MTNHPHLSTNPSTPGSTLSTPCSPHTTRVRISAEEQIRLLEEDLISARETIRTKNEIIHTRNEDIAVLQDKIDDLNQQVEALQCRVNRQEITIRNQSRTIQDPRSLRSRRVQSVVTPSNTPSRPPGLPPVPSQPYHMSFSRYANYQYQLPTPFVGQQSLRGTHAQITSQHQPQQQMPMAAPLFTQTTRIPPWSGNPQHLSQRGTSRFPANAAFPGTARPARPELNGTGAGERLQGLFMPMVQLREPSLQTVNAQRPLHEAVTNSDEQAMIAASSKKDPSYAGIEFETNASNIAGRFSALWIKSDQFAKTYALSEDATLLPEQLPARLKDYMMIHPSTDVAALFLNSPGNKQLYVAKVINFYLCKHVLKYTEVVRGCDSHIDSEILGYKKRIMHDITSTAKHCILTAISKCVIRASENPDFQDFCRQYRENHTKVLRALLDPLLAPEETSSAAQKSLEEIVADAHKLGVELYSLPYDARCHFPEVEEAYDPTLMLNMDNDFDITLVNNAKVKMSVTPVIRLGQNQFQPVRVRNASIAKVFTGLPGVKEDRAAGSGRTPGRGAKR